MKKSKVFFTVTCILCLSSLIAWPQESTNIGEQLKDSSPPPITEFISIGKIFWSIVVFLVSYFVIRIVSRIISFFSEKSAKYRITLKGILPVFQIFGWIVAITFIIRQIINPPFETILAVAASLGFAVGFASQDILKNIFGGVVIIFDRTFQVGDKIEVGGHYGEVMSIGLRSTKIVTADDSMVTIPNSEIVNNTVSNSNSGEANCQVVAEIYLPLSVDMTMVRTIATEAAQSSKYIFLNKPIVVLFQNEIKEKRSFLKMRLKAYVMDIRYEFAFKSDMTEKVITALLERKIILEDF
jgi:MscS family membrane protein